MNLEYICEQMVRILHGNITCISKSGAIEACYGDMAVQYNPLFTNSEFLSAVHNREKKDYPDLFYEKDTILYGKAGRRPSMLWTRSRDRPRNSRPMCCWTTGPRWHRQSAPPECAGWPWCARAGEMSGSPPESPSWWGRCWMFRPTASA